MKKFDLPLILDVIFIFFAALLICFTVLRYYLESMFLATGISIFVAVIFAALGLKLLSKKHGGAVLKKEELAKKKEIFFNLAFYSDNELNNYFLKLFEKNGTAAEKTKDGIYLKEKNLLVKFIFKLTKVTTDNFINAVKNTDKPLVILTDTAENDVLSYAKKINAKIVTGENLFVVMQKNECYPEIKYSLKANEKVVKRRINIELTRKKAKHFFIFGITLLLFSFIVAFPIYYLVMGNLMIIASIILRFYGKKPENADTII